MSLTRWTSSHFKSADVPSVIAKHQKRRSAEQALQEAYAVVDLRDGPHCRATGRHTSPGAPDPRVRREHEHHENRSTAPEKRADPNNIYVVCAEAHQLIHAGWLIAEGKPAGTMRFHWSADVPAEKRPFHIKSRRRSQQQEQG